ncbi:WDR82.2 family protein [Megaselia abdita]
MIVKPVNLDDDLLRSFKVAKVFRENTESISSISFSNSGVFLASSGLDTKIDLYNCHSGTHVHSTFSQKYGVDNICYSPEDDKILHSSTSNNDAIRYLCFLNNSYVRYFKGHTKKVTGLNFAGKTGSFVSSSLDKTVRLWDLRTEGFQAMLNMSGPSLATFDPEGFMVAVAEDSQVLKLFDRRNLANPLLTGLDTKSKENNWISVEFSPDGGSILLSTDSSLMVLIDAFTLESVHVLTGYPNNSDLRVRGDFSADSKYVFCGGNDGHIHVWKTLSGTKLCRFVGDHQSATQCVKHNPMFCMFASACTNMEFWIPFDPSA